RTRHQCQLRPRPALPHLARPTIGHNYHLTSIGASKRRHETRDGSTRLPKSVPLRRLAALYLHAEFGGVCELCDRAIDATLPTGHPARIQIDHIEATTYGGPDVWGNVRVVHGTCNSELADGRFPLSTDWARRITDLETTRYLGGITRADVMVARTREYDSVADELKASLSNFRVASTDKRHLVQLVMFARLRADSSRIIANRLGASDADLVS
ncbi:HNH endonuclease, partial [Cryobacterium flavum]